MKALCVSVGNVPGAGGWLTVHREYDVLGILALPGRSIKFRVLADDGITPILADSALFAASATSLPRSWVCTVAQDGVVEMGPKEWLEPGFWERFFDQEPDAVESFHRAIQSLYG
jgi:hypothetical protein